MPSAVLIVASTRVHADPQEILRIQDTVSALREQGRAVDVLGLADLATVEEVAMGDEERDLLERRQAARAARDFAEADRLRDALRARGFEVRDGPQGPELVPVP